MSFVDSSTSFGSPFPFRRRLSTGANEKIQLSALLRAFKNTVELQAE